MPYPCRQASAALTPSPSKAKATSDCRSLAPTSPQMTPARRGAEGKLDLPLSDKNNNLTRPPGRASMSATWKVAIVLTSGAQGPETYIWLSKIKPEFHQTNAERALSGAACTSRRSRPCATSCWRSLTSVRLCQCTTSRRASWAVGAVGIHTSVSLWSRTPCSTPEAIFCLSWCEEHGHGAGGLSDQRTY